MFYGTLESPVEVPQGGHKEKGQAPSPHTWSPQHLCLCHTAGFPVRVQGVKGVSQQKSANQSIKKDIYTSYMLFHLTVRNSLWGNGGWRGLQSDSTAHSQSNQPHPHPAYVDSEGSNVTTWNSPHHSWMTLTMKTSSSLNQRLRGAKLLRITKEAQRATSTKCNMWTSLKSWFE